MFCVLIDDEVRVWVEPQNSEGEFIPQSAALFMRTHVHYIHTLYTAAVAVRVPLDLLDVCISSAVF